MPEKLLGEYREDISPDRFLFIRAKPVEFGAPHPSFTFAAPRSRLLKLDVLPNNIRVPLISPRVASLLMELCPHDFQLLPARIKTPDASIDDYFLLNVTTEISGIDHENSILILFRGYREIMKVERLRYAAGSMGSHHLARETEYMPYLWASDVVVRAFEKEKFKGCKFQPPEYIHP